MIKPAFNEAILALSHEEALEQARNQIWYHSMDLTPGLSVKGDFDLREVVQGYGFPEDLTGQTVLDIGRSSGFFAFEFERRNAAQVVATELATLFDKSYVGGEITAGLLSEYMKWDRRKRFPNVTESGERLDFFLAHKLRNSKVVPVQANIEDADKLGEFDLVFVGSLLNHVRDVGGALMSVRKATKGLCVISNPVLLDGGDKPRIEFNGTASSWLTTWFKPNVAALVNLVEAAGFVDVKVHNPALDLPFGKSVMPHAIIHARRGTDQEVRAKFAAHLERVCPGITEMVQERA
jgi:tRNA (mo5U34)-methyltransferase